MSQCWIDAPRSATLREMGVFRFAAVPAAVVLSIAAVAPASASPTIAVNSKPLPCRASMSKAHPADYTTTDVLVTTASRAGVTTIAHYRTVNRRYHRTANAKGKAKVPYYISGATPGYRVVVDVYVSRAGRKGACKTSFTPHR
jgi:hypothetical protein